MGGRGASSGNGYIPSPYIPGVDVSFLASDVTIHFSPPQPETWNLKPETPPPPPQPETWNLKPETLPLVRCEAIARVIEAGRMSQNQKEALFRDLRYAREVKLSIGDYSRTAVLTDNLSTDVVLPASLKNAVSPETPIALQFQFNYTTVRSTDTTHGATYPFLPANRRWTITSRPVGETESRYTRFQDSVGMVRPTLRWVSGNQVKELYVDGMTTEPFLQQMGLELSLDKGGVVLSKRISRVIRPYFLSHQFRPDEVSITYLQQGEAQAKQWDGAAVVSWKMLQKLLLAENLPSGKRAELEQEIQTAGRVEFTILTAKGQDKGHAIVSDDLPADFLLPEDTKGQVKLTSGKVFVGINFVHSKKQMAMDEQSTINLHEAVDEEFLLDRLYERGELFKEGLENGRISALMGQIHPEARLEDLEAWPLREFLASGGDPRWFSSHIRSILNQHMEPLQAYLDNPAENRLRLPVPGGRFYVMPSTVGRAAGLDLSIPRGQAKLDSRQATVWVNAEDWVSLADSPQEAGIAAILGGADNDDALWVLPHTNPAGEKQLLLWRSPNEPGEYVILKPTTDSETIPWHRTLEDTVRFMPLDTRQLEPRKDFRPEAERNEVDMTSGGGLGEGQGYSVEVMELAVERAAQNAGVLGQFINQAMVNKAIGRNTPLPAPTEVVIDAVNKTGEDLSPVRWWSENEGAAIRATGTAVPRAIQHRLSRPPEGTSNDLPPLRATTNHWLDIRDEGVRTHLQAMESYREQLTAQAMPPEALFDAVFQKPESIQVGASYLATYGRAVKEMKAKRPLGVLTDADHDQLRKTAETFLSNYPEEQHTEILRGAMVSLYIKEERGSDRALWLQGEKTEQGVQPGIGHKSIQALREIGLLGEILPTKEGLITYHDPASPLHSSLLAPPSSPLSLPSPLPTSPSSSFSPPSYLIPHPSYLLPPPIIGIQGAWLNWYLAEKGQPLTNELSPAEVRQAKKRFQQAAQTSFQDMELLVREEDGAKVVYTAEGHRLGTLAGERADQFTDGQQIHIRHALAHGGNLRVILKSY